MTKLVYLVGGNDAQIIGMFNAMSGFAMTSVPEKADILCHQGGADVNPKFYGEVPLMKTYTNAGHDKIDLDLWNKYPEKAHVGICRGGQFCNVMSGGAMWQDVDNHGRTHELINLMPIEGKYAQGDKVLVTSTHHQMMIAGDGGEVLAIAHEAKHYQSAMKDRPRPEFDTEVVWYEHTKSLCFQPHPEYGGTHNTRPYFVALMQHFFGG